MPQPPAKSDGAPSIISANLHIVGDLNTEGEIQVDGTVDGDVKSKVLTIGTNATINGEIIADNVVVRGAVNGRIKASVVQLTSTAQVSGDIWHESLAVESGATLEGHCKRWRMEEESVATETATEASESEPEAYEEGEEDAPDEPSVVTGLGGLSD